VQLQSLTAVSKCPQNPKAWLT